jgi:hypothetical protein
VSTPKGAEEDSPKPASQSSREVTREPQRAWRRAPPPRAGVATPSASPLAPSPSDAKRKEARQLIETQLRAVKAEWSGVSAVPKDAVASGDFSPGIEFTRHLPLQEIAGELARLPPGGQLVLVTSAKDSWLAVREGPGVQLAPLGSLEAGALSLTHRVRSDLHFLGTKIEIQDEGLRLVGAVPAASTASAVRLLPSDLVRLGEAELAKGSLPVSLSVRRLGEEQTVPLPSGHPALRESEQALRRRMGGVAIPQGHWLETAMVPAGALLTSATIDGREVWMLGEALEHLDAARDAAKRSGRPLAVALVTAEGFETRTLTPQADGSWKESARRSVEVTLSGFAMKGSEVRALLEAGAPYGFGVGAAARFTAEGERIGAAGAEPSLEPRLEAQPGLDPKAVKAYQEATRFGFDRARAKPRLSDAQVLVEETNCLKLAENIRVFGNAIARLNPAADERALAGGLARLRAEEKVAIEAFLKSQAGEESPEPFADALSKSRVRVADALVNAVQRTVAQRSLTVVERCERIDALLEHALGRLWPQADADPTSMPTPVELAGQFQRVADQPPSLDDGAVDEAEGGGEEGEDGDSAVARGATSEGGEPPQAVPLDEAYLVRRLHDLEGILDEWKSAVARSDGSLAKAFETQFEESQNRYSWAAAPAQRNSTREHFSDLVRVTAEIVEESEKVLQQGPGPRAPAAREAIYWLSGLLDMVRTGELKGEDARRQLEAYRALEGAELVGRGPSKAQPGVGVGSTTRERFASLNELEVFLENVKPNERVQLYSANQQTFLNIAKGAQGNWSVNLGTRTNSSP